MSSWRMNSVVRRLPYLTSEVPHLEFQAFARRSRVESRGHGWAAGNATWGAREGE
jgi:hypothetical protein